MFNLLTADSSEICHRPELPSLVSFCSGVVCDCPAPPYQCPPDSIIVSTRLSPCCVSYECVCPEISCPLLMECGQGVQPLPNYRGNRFPGRCCPDYSFEGENVFCFIIVLAKRALKIVMPLYFQRWYSGQFLPQNANWLLALVYYCCLSSRNYHFLVTSQ